MSLPALVSRLINEPTTLEWQRQHYGLPLPLLDKNSTGGWGTPGSGITDKNGWLYATPGTVTANAENAQFLVVQCPFGKKVIIDKINIQASGAADLHIFKYLNLNNTLDGTTGTVYLSTTYQVYNGNISGSSGGFYTIDFSKNPLILNCGEYLDFYWAVNSTTGVNWQLTFEGCQLWMGDNYDAKYKILQIGDSLCGQTELSSALPIVELASGTITGSWPMILQRKYQAAGFDVLTRNIGIAGTTTSQWAWKVANGHLDTPFKYANLVRCSLGMNDTVSGTANLCPSHGTDGIYKKALKQIITAYFHINPKGSFIHPGIPNSAVSSANASYSGSNSDYSGKTIIQSYRIDLAAAISELKTANPTWDLAASDVSTAYPANATYCLASETSSTWEHPNAIAGQPAFANTVWAVEQTMGLYANNLLIP